MTFLRSVWIDLVEKRLWPVALALLAALVAVPVLLGGAADPGLEPVAVTGATGATGASLAAVGPLGAGAQVQLASATPLRRDRLGVVRDPFKQHKLPAAARAAVSTVTAAPAGGGSSSATADGAKPGTGSGGATDPGAPATPTTPAPGPGSTTPAPVQAYTAVVRFGRIGVHRPRKDVARLAPLPNTDDPFLVFVGVLGNPRTAVFLLSSDVTATGEGTCRPRPTSCETVELKPGESERLAVVQDDGSVRTWVLDLVEVVKGDGSAAKSAPATTTPATAAATKVRAKAAAKAKEAAESTETGSSRYRYDKATGLLRRVPVEKRKKAVVSAAAAFAAVAGTEDDPLVQFTPVP